MRTYDLKGTYGKAWKRRSPPLAQQDGLIVCWYVKMSALLGGGWWAVAAVCLPDGTREVHALPVKQIEDPDGKGHFPRGEVFFAVQFAGVDNGGAGGISQVLVETCIQGGMPLGKQLNAWAALVGTLIRRVQGNQTLRIDA